MQSTGDFHNQIIIPFLGITKQLFDDSTPFDPIDDMFNDDTDARNEPIVLFLLCGQSFPLGFFLGLKSRDTLRFITLKSRIFIQGDLLWERQIFFIDDLFVMTFAFIGLAQIIDFTRMEAANNEILDRVCFFLPL